MALMEKIVTYSKSRTLILTEYCANTCLYCGFRDNEGTLIRESEIEKLLSFASKSDCSEILVMSGERPEERAEIAGYLKNRGYSDFAGFAVDVCRMVLKAGMLPHTNIGVLSCDELSHLKEVNASMGLMIESTSRKIAEILHPQKDPSERLRMLEDAGRLEIPFTTGILVGLGETGKERIESLERIIESHSRFDQVQEIIIQNFVPNKKSKLQKADHISIDDYIEMISYVRGNSDIAVQVPQNLNPFFAELVKHGISDIGGISEAEDRINPESPWTEIDKLQREMKSSGIRLKRRLPIYPKYIKKGWYSKKAGVVIDNLMKKPIYGVPDSKGK